MKYISYKLSAVATLVAVMLSSCNDFLDQVPDNRADPRTPEAVSELLVSAYPECGYALVSETLSDNAGDVGKWTMGFNKVEEELYYWKDVTGEDTDSPEGIWDYAYAAIAVTNHALEIAEENKEEYDFSAQIGEALVARAYNHFILVNFFAKHYDPATAKTDLGIPYVTTRETTPLGDYKRISVDSVYTLIEKDLLAGMALIDDNTYTVSRYHFTTAATAAFAARFYQFRAKDASDWENVVKYTNRVLPSDPTKMLREWNGKYADFSYDELEQTYTRSTESCNLLLMSQVTLLGRAAMNRYKLTSSLVDLIYIDSPKVYGKLPLGFPIYGSGVYNHIPKFKEHFKTETINANYGWPYVMFTAFTTDECLLNRAEAYAMTGKTAECIADLNYYYRMRVDAEYVGRYSNITLQKVTDYTPLNEIDPWYASTMTTEQVDLVEAIVDARRQEFLHEGMRWFDIRRFNIEVTHISFDERTKVVLAKDDLRRSLQIPKQALASGIAPNPR